MKIGGENRSPKLASLQSLRFIFIYLVFLSHFSLKGEAPLFSPGGDCGVSFFLVLSGFVLSLSYKPSTGYKKWLFSRFKKIYPLYIITLVFAFFILKWNFNLFNIVPIITLTQSWIPFREFYFGGNPTAWFISDIIFLYIVFFPIRCHVLKASPIKLGIVTIFIGGLYIVLCSHIPHDWVNWGLYIFPPMRVLDFFLGIICYRVYAYLVHNAGTPNTAVSTILQLFTIAVVVLSCNLWYRLPERFNTVLLFYIPSFLVVLVFALTNKAKTFVNAIISNRGFVWLGNISFEFYLLHVPVISIVGKLSQLTFPGINLYIWLGTATIATILLSAATHVAVQYLIAIGTYMRPGAVRMWKRRS